MEDILNKVGGLLLVFVILVATARGVYEFVSADSAGSFLEQLGHRLAHGQGA